MQDWDSRTSLRTTDLRDHLGKWSPVACTDPWRGEMVLRGHNRELGGGGCMGLVPLS